jgi:hypothetical protein
MGQVQLIEVRGVNFTAYVKEAATVFPEMTKRSLRAHQTEGLVDMVSGRDIERWLPQYMRDSWRQELDPDENRGSSSVWS